MDIGRYTSSILPPANAPQATGDAQVSASLGGLADAVLAVDQRFRKEADDLQRATDAAALTLDAHKAVSDLSGSLSGAGWQSYEGEWSKGFQKIRQGILDRVQDPTLKLHMTSTLDDLGWKGSLEAKATARKMAVDQQDAFWVEKRPQVIDAALSSRSAEDETAAVGMGVGIIAAQERGGMIDAKEAATRRTGLLADYGEAKAKRAMNVDPTGFLASLDADPFYRGLDATKREVLRHEAMAAERTRETGRDKSFKDLSGRHLSKALVLVNGGTLTRSDVETYLVGTRYMTDEDERTLLHAVKAKEKEDADGGGTGPEGEDLTGAWSLKIEQAWIRRDTKTLRDYSRIVGSDESIPAKGRAKLLEVINRRLEKAADDARADDNREDRRPPGFSDATHVLDRYFGYEPMLGSFKIPADQEKWDAAMRRVTDAAYGVERDPRTGKTRKVAPKTGYALIAFARGVVDEDKSAKVAKKATPGIPTWSGTGTAPKPIPPDGSRR